MFKFNKDTQISTKSFVGDVIKYIPAIVIPAVTGFISIPIVTNLFAPEVYGKYTYVSSIVMIFITIGNWLQQAIIRYYPEYEIKGKIDVLYENALIMMLISTIILTASYFFLIPVFNNPKSDELLSLLYMGNLFLISVTVLNFVGGFLRAKREVNMFSLSAIWRSVMGLICGLIIIYFFNIGIQSLFIGVIVSIIIILPFLWKKAVVCRNLFKIKISLPFVKEFSNYSFPLLFSSLTAWVLNLSDLYFLQYYRGPFEVGIYSASYRIAEKTVIVVGTLFIIASRPTGMRIWEEKGVKEAKEFVFTVLRYYLLICMPIAFGLSILAKPIIILITNEQYVSGYKIMSLIACGAFFLGLEQIFQLYLLFYKQSKIIAYAFIIAGVFNLILNIIIIPVLGYIGAAINTFLSYAILAMLMFAFSKKVTTWRFPIKTLLNAIFASSLMGFVIYIINNTLNFSNFLNLSVTVSAGIVTYALLLLVMKELLADEKKIIKQIMTRLLQTIKAS